MRGAEAMFMRVFCNTCSDFYLEKYSIHASMVDLLGYRATSGERNFIDRIKASIFLEAVLAIEIM